MMLKDFSKVFILLLAFLLIVGCSNKKYNLYSNDIESVLKQAKENRSEIEKSLDYFINQGDSLKIKAIFFLVENIVGKYSLIPEHADNPFRKIILENNRPETEAWEPSKSKIGLAFDSVYQVAKYVPRMKKIKDIEIITADYLIANVEKSFKTWNKTKAFTKCTFKDFCEYVLPYRLNNEPLSYWREEAYGKFSFLLDSIQDPIEISKAVVKLSGMHYNAGMSKYPYQLTLKELENLHWGSCGHLALYLTLSLRAIGIPSSIDIVPSWANRSDIHVWNVVMDKNGVFRDFGFDAEGSNRILYKISKIYRTTFSPSKGVLINLNPTWKDVTAEYSLPVSDVVLKRTDQSNNNFSFLCTFNNKDWVPIAVSQKMDKEQIIFQNIARGIPFNNYEIAGYRNEGKGIVLLPAFLNENALNAFSVPIILKENGETHLLSPDYSASRTVKLFRKYPKYGQFNVYAVRTIGGAFEISNHKDFSGKKKIHVIKESFGHAISEVQLPKTYNCRYVRYTAPDDSGFNVSELQFFYQGKKIHGTPISSDSKKTPEELAVFCDDNIQTYYAAEARKAFIGLDFGKVVNIDKIVYAPRSDDNDVAPGEEYELLYWDNEWVSLGKRVADKFYLEYTGVPGNALLLLRNHTKGVEERIFTYENDEQIWW